MLSQLRESKSNHSSIARNRLSTQISVSNTILPGKEPGLLGETAGSRLILGLGQEIYKMSLEHLVVPERKEMCQRDIGINRKIPNGNSYSHLSKKVSKIVLGFCPKYKVSIHEPILP